jgi:hypothetical protein
MRGGNIDEMQSDSSLGRNTAYQEVHALSLKIFFGRSAIHDAAHNS